MQTRSTIDIKLTYANGNTREVHYDLRGDLVDATMLFDVVKEIAKRQSTLVPDPIEEARP